jgi:hypothetical protein
MVAFITLVLCFISLVANPANKQVGPLITGLISLFVIFIAAACMPHMAEDSADDNTYQE